MLATCKLLSKLNSTLSKFNQTMAKSKFEYVKSFETDDNLLPNCWIVVKVAGKNFTKFTWDHDFERPNDRRALDLMNRAAVWVMQEFNNVSLAYGKSDEYSFVFRKTTDAYHRRGFKFVTHVSSLFSTSFVYHWHEYLKCTLKYPPVFDTQLFLIPADDNLKDYLCWRQHECHVNNLYNTTFWMLVNRGNVNMEDVNCLNILFMKL